MRILVVEDDEMLRSAITSVLTGEGYSVEGTGHGDEGLFLAEQEIYDLLVLDIMLPSMNGLEIVKQLRLKTIHVPVLLLTAKDSIEDRITGLSIGADDYLVKPFALGELLARINVLLRNNGGGAEELLAYKEIAAARNVSRNAVVNLVVKDMKQQIDTGLVEYLSNEYACNSSK